MGLKTIGFVAALGVLVAGSFYFSYAGARLPGPDEEGSVSLRNVAQRRSHFFHHYAMGK